MRKMRNAKEAGKHVEEVQEIAEGLNAQAKKTKKRGRPPDPQKIPTQLINFRIPESVVKLVDVIVKAANEEHTITGSEGLPITRVSGSVTRSDVVRVLLLEMITKMLYENAQWGITCPRNAYIDEFPQYEREDSPNNNEMYRRMLAERYITKSDAEQSLKEFITSSYGYENGYRRSDFAILAYNEEGDMLPDGNNFDSTRRVILNVVGRDYDANDEVIRGALTRGW